jgi:hypothetical protein
MYSRQQVEHQLLKSVASNEGSVAPTIRRADRNLGVRQAHDTLLRERAPVDTREH